MNRILKGVDPFHKPEPSGKAWPDGLVLAFLLFAGLVFAMVVLAGIIIVRR